MNHICSRCKTPRILGVTDGIETEFEQFKTCMKCREKLKEYRRNHVDKRKSYKNNEKFRNDDRVNVIIMSHFDENLKTKLHTHKKYADFNLILKNMYLNSNNKDLKIDEVFKIPEFTLPHFFNDENLEISKVNGNSDIIDTGEYSIFTNLLLKQTEKDEKFKSNLINSLNLHFINRIKHILTLCNYEFKFYSSSWKNGKYYINLKCYDDKNAMKRFGIDIDNLVKTNEEGNQDSNSNEVSLLKSKLNDWVKPTDKDSSKLSFFVNSNEVNSKLLKTPGFYCHSKLTLIADYSKLEIRFKFSHKHHRFELNENSNNETDDSEEEGADNISIADDRSEKQNLDRLLKRFKKPKNEADDPKNHSKDKLKKKTVGLFQEDANHEGIDESNDINASNETTNNNNDDNDNDKQDNNDSIKNSDKLTRLQKILDL